jgi:hypothetical protein
MLLAIPFAVASAIVMLQSTTTGTDAQTAAALGQWSATQTWPVQPTHANMLPTGQVLFYPAWSQGDTPYLWDPSGTIVGSALPGYDIFCSGHTFLSDGRVFVAGGHITSHVGMPHASIYNPFSDTWTQLPDMNAGRWYPSTMMLPNGDVLVVSGEESIVDGAVVYDPVPQVWQTASASWRDLSNASLVIDQWYPFLYLAPNGKVFEAGPGQLTRYLDTTGLGAWTTVDSNRFGDRPQGSSVMYDDGKVLILGGADPPTATAETIDLNSPSPSWQPIASMSQARRQANATLLPDGKVLVTGGSSGAGFDNSSYPVYAAEEWDPATQQWTTLASDSVYRGYHSTALLLPDGRVLVGGGEIGGATAKIYSPPYLFAGARPTITGAPAAVAYGQSFSVQTPDAANITQVNWIRLGSVTHAFDESQRINRLSFVAGAGSLTATAPSDAIAAPPGYYMLFILNASGVPSVAKIIQITANVASPPAAPSSLTTTALSSTEVHLGWADTASTEAGFQVERSADGATFVQIATLGANVTGYNDATVASSRSYWYRVRAYNAAGFSSYSNTASTAVPAPLYNFEDGTAQGWQVGGGTTIAAVNSQVAAYEGSHSLSLTLTNTTTANWASAYLAPSTGGPVAGTTITASVLVPTGGATGLQAQIALQDGGNAWYNDMNTTTLVPGTWSQLSWIVPSGAVGPVRWFGVWFTSAAGVTWSGTAFVDAVDMSGAPPSTPTPTSAATATSTLTPTPTASRTPTPTSTRTPTPTRTPLTPTSSPTPRPTSTLTPTPTRTTPPTATPTPTLTPTPSPLPAAPSNLVATAVSSSQINLAWLDNASNEQGFNVEQSLNGTTFTQIASVGANVTGYSDAGLSPSTNYWYRVQAYNAFGSSAYSTTVHVRTKPK